MYPQLVVQFTCQHVANSDCNAFMDTYFMHMYACCSVVWMLNVTRAAIEGISVTIKTPYVSGVILQQCLHLHIQSSTYFGIQDQFDPEIELSVGIMAYESSDMEMDSLESSNFTVGVVLYIYIYIYIYVQKHDLIFHSTSAPYCGKVYRLSAWCVIRLPWLC